MEDRLELLRELWSRSPRVSAKTWWVWEICGFLLGRDSSSYTSSCRCHIEIPNQPWGPQTPVKLRDLCKGGPNTVFIHFGNAGTVQG